MIRRETITPGINDQEGLGYALIAAHDKVENSTCQVHENNDNDPNQLIILTPKITANNINESKERQQNQHFPNDENQGQFLPAQTNWCIHVAR